MQKLRETRLPRQKDDKGRITVPDSSSQVVSKTFSLTSKETIAPYTL